MITIPGHDTRYMNCNKKEVSGQPVLLVYFFFSHPATGRGGPRWSG